MGADDRAAILARRAEVTASIARRQHAAGQHEAAKATEYSGLAARTALAAIKAKVVTA
jgi:hypothetical protein